MKASLKIEAIGDNIDQMYRHFANLTNMLVPGLGTVTFGDAPKKSYWVAQIMGHDPKYRYRRYFLFGKKDYKFANSKGSRGVFVYYLLESENIYEVKTSKRRYFCTVSEDGDIVEISKEVVDKWVNDHLELPY
jgi:hypothetical protein